jgi:hypothetical protein
MIPIATSRGMTWIALFNQVFASRGIGRDWVPGTTSIFGVRRALVQVPFQPGGRQVFHKESKSRRKQTLSVI